MRVLTIFFAVLAVASLAWGGYWFVGSSALRDRTESWLEQRRADGWQAEAQVTVQGFPNRFDLTLDNVALADPQSGLAWQAPFFQLLALSYRPNHLIALWPDTQQIKTPYETITLLSRDMRASLVFDAESRAALNRSSLTAGAVELSSDIGWQASATDLRAAVERTEKQKNRYHLGLEATGLRPGGDLLGRLDPQGTLPQELEMLRLDSLAAFDAPWNLDAIDRRRPQLTSLQLDDLRAQWGDMKFRLTGQIDVDAQGYPAGKLTLEAQNWRRMLSLAVSAGAVPQGLAGTVESVLGMMAGGDGDALNAPLNFRDGRLFFGPLPIGPAPRLVLR
ncbi:DUF2125 domain-containing protein [Brevirhabdus sp.]|uniref:DUF2125 domain-containing protein n=1 Tax=Brevirhabdus sp. TaxID=2004514 RepID=UPI00405949CE